MVFSDAVVREYLAVLSQDNRVTVWHMAIIYGIMQLIPGNDLWRPFNSSRRKVMETAHIKNLMTYHKYIAELQVLGYLRYEPSYHPEKGTLMGLLPGDKVDVTETVIDFVARLQTD